MCTNFRKELKRNSSALHQQFNEQEEFRQILNSYISIQILANQFNTTKLSSIILPCYHFTICCFFIVVARGAIKESLPTELTIQLYFSLIGLIAIFKFITALIYQIPESSNTMLKIAKSTDTYKNAYYYRLVLKAFQPIRISFGFLGYFDKEIYIFLGAFITNLTLDIIIM